MRRAAQFLHGNFDIVNITHEFGAVAKGSSHRLYQLMNRFNRLGLIMI